MPRGYRTAPLGSLEVPGCPYSVRVLRVGYNRPQPDGSVLADGSVTLVSGGPVTALVDTGGPWDAPLLPALLGAHGVTPRDVTHLVVTHGHSDHAGNLNLFPRATTLVGFDLSRGEGVYLPHGLAQGVPLPLDPPFLEVLPTPGHVRAHVSLVARGTSLGTVVVAGDLFEREGDEGEWGALSEDPREQRRSRRRVVAVADVIVPGHGPPFRVFRDHQEGDEDGDSEGDGDGDDEVVAGGGTEGRGDEE
ncbi:metallo-beta-lactamase domain-containing protein 1 [Neopelma chrysocephalum]|uniref:metallo-beta-lactamase domain-containing protein 1 n=1 Tax=Neopelma chrysocephalum TaxID=114329 RepID=UPI000FCD152F|nr:metallo-beta-lactamase domain-containing protein 1 [Neopelma chrysocephalum]